LPLWKEKEQQVRGYHTG